MDLDTISGKTPLIFKVKISISQNKRKFSAYFPNTVKSTFSFTRANGKKAILRNRSIAFHVIYLLCFSWAFNATFSRPVCANSTSVFGIAGLCCTFLFFCLDMCFTTLQHNANISVSLHSFLKAMNPKVTNIRYE